MNTAIEVDHARVELDPGVPDLCSISAPSSMYFAPHGLYRPA